MSTTDFIVDDGGDFGPRNTQSVEERSFQVALSMVESMFSGMPPIGYRTRKCAKDMIRQTMEKTLNKPEIREVLAKNVDIWMRLHSAFHYAIPAISDRSLRESYAETQQPDFQLPETSTLIADNHASLQEDLTLLNNLLVIARNMLAIKEVAQDICAAVQLHHQITKLIELCVRVTSKGYDGENVDNITRGKVNDIIELYKKLLVTSLQFLHNLTMGNDRLKMAFWFDMLFDSDLHNEFNNDYTQDLPSDQLRVEVVQEEVRNWLQRNWTKTPQAQEILDAHTERVKFGHTAGPLPREPYGAAEFAEWAAENIDHIESPEHPSPGGTLTAPVWQENAPSKFEQDRLYGRVSHEIDVWWKLVRDVNYDAWTQNMEGVDIAMQRAEQAKHSALQRYIREHPEDGEQEYDHQQDYVQGPNGDELIDHDELDERSQHADNGDEDELEDEEEEEEEEDDDPYPEGEPLRGLLTEIPNILDTKQIEALHMTVKACIVDAMGSGLTKSGENLQKTRCKMFLALDCGKNLLREMLVFIAVWEQAETQFIFQITAQIIESFHHNALLPFAWNSLRIAKDIISPAQTVLLRLINYIFRARNGTSIYNDTKDYHRDAKLIFFLYNYFRCRVVPDCIALIYAQAQIRQGEAHPQDFPVDLWDMERAKDGLSQYLDFISVVADIPKMRPLLVQWEATHELVQLLKALEAGVSRKPLVDPVRPSVPIPHTTPHVQSNGGHPEAISAIERPYDQITGGMNDMNLGTIESAAMPALHDTPHMFPWTGIKVRIIMILTSLVSPVNGRSGPGNPMVQSQLLKHGGVLALLNCCVYDGHNEFLKERATLALKWVMDGCPEAQNWVSELSPLPNQKPAQYHHDGPPVRRQTGP